MLHYFQQWWETNVLSLYELNALYIKFDCTFVSPQDCFPDSINIAYIIKPEKFWEKKRTSLGSAKYNFEVSCRIKIEQLHNSKKLLQLKKNKNVHKTKLCINSHCPEIEAWENLELLIIYFTVFTDLFSKLNDVQIHINFDMKKWIQHYDGSSFDITPPDYCDAWCRYKNVDILNNRYGNVYLHYRSNDFFVDMYDLSWWFIKVHRLFTTDSRVWRELRVQPWTVDTVKIG